MHRLVGKWVFRISCGLDFDSPDVHGFDQSPVQCLDARLPGLLGQGRNVRRRGPSGGSGPGVCSRRVCFVSLPCPLSFYSPVALRWAALSHCALHTTMFPSSQTQKPQCPVILDQNLWNWSQKNLSSSRVDFPWYLVPVSGSCLTQKEEETVKM